MFGFLKKDKNNEQENGCNQPQPTFAEQPNFATQPTFNSFEGLSLSKEPDSNGIFNLKKGDALSLSKIDFELTNIHIGLGWDAPETYNGSNFDIDASVSLINNKLEEIEQVYFGNLDSNDGAINHQGDNLTGDGDGDDEEIYVNFKKINPQVTRLLVVADIFGGKLRKQCFKQVTNAFMRIVNKNTGKEIVRFNLNEQYGEYTGIIIGEFILYNNEWIFNAIGQGTCLTRKEMKNYYKK